MKFLHKYIEMLAALANYEQTLKMFWSVHSLKSPSFTIVLRVLYQGLHIVV